MRKSLLVVEDDFSVREELHDILERMGYDIYNAANGREALSLLGRIPNPALILTDLVMPVMDGTAFIETVRSIERFRNTPVMVMSVRDGPTRGATAHLRKPFDLKALLETVQALTSGPEFSPAG